MRIKEVEEWCKKKKVEIQVKKVIDRKAMGGRVYDFSSTNCEGFAVVTDDSFVIYLKDISEDLKIDKEDGSYMIDNVDAEINTIKKYIYHNYKEER